jgi:hypothetical protein
MNQLGNGLYRAEHYEDSLSVREAELSTLRRLGAPEERILVVQSNLTNTYEFVGRDEEAMHMREDLYSRTSDLWGEEHRDTLLEANNYAMSLVDLRRFEEAKSLLRKSMPVARRVLGQDDYLTLRMRWNYAEALYKADSATLAELREAVNTLEETERTARRVLGDAHPITEGIEDDLQRAQAALYARGLP